MAPRTRSCPETTHAHKTDTLLADGRELIYFDEPADARRPHRPSSTGAHCRRRIPRRRCDSIGSSTSGSRSPVTGRPAPTCRPTVSARCARRVRPTHRRSRRPTTTSWCSRIAFPRFPWASWVVDEVEHDGADGDGLFATAPGFGRCEVVCFTSDHDAAFSSLSPARVRTVIDAWVDRTEELSRNPKIEQVFCFENRGEEIGVTLSHPHGQIYGYPYVTPRTKQMLASARAHPTRLGATCSPTSSARRPKVG